jgi:hypothetical protein
MLPTLSWWKREIAWALRTLFEGYERPRILLKLLYLDIATSKVVSKKMVKATLVAQKKLISASTSGTKKR